MCHIVGEASLELQVLLERGGHVVEGLTQLTDFVLARQAAARRKLTVTNQTRGRRDASDGVHKAARNQVANNAGDKNGNNRS